MSFKKRLRTVFVCLVLEAGVLVGAPVRMEQIHELLRSLNQPKLAQTDPEQNESESILPEP
jgi:hypothetical protein